MPWEGPGLITTALAGIATRTLTLAAQARPQLPEADELCGLVVMGGPMNADDVARYPGMAAERALLAAAVEAGVPTLGVCLGAQLLARALGACVEPGAASEIGWAPIVVHQPDDPLVGALAGGAPVLHWHGDACELPEGAVCLASTEATPVQAFRVGAAWGLQFHIEVTAELVAGWLATDVMQAEAERALGPHGAAELTNATAAALERLTPIALASLGAFASLARARAFE